MIVSVIVACSENDVIGKANKLPWHLPADLKHFKKLTMGNSIIMGRKTHDSIGKILPGRKNIILTKNPDYSKEGAVVAHSINDALNICKDEDEIFIIGGSSIYSKAFDLGIVNKIYLTIVHEEMEGDTFFKLPNPENWMLVSRKKHAANEKNPHDFSFLTYIWGSRYQLLNKS